MKIAILGAGALGSVFGALMARKGIDISLLDVNKAHIDSINKHGLLLDEPEQSSRITIEARHPAEADTATDLLILLTKTYHSDSALVSVQSVIDNGAGVLSIQNGLGNTARLRKRVADDRILYGSTQLPGDYLGPGHVATQGGDDQTVFRAFSDAGEALAFAVQRHLHSLNFVKDDSADTVLWHKAAFNCAMNSICSLGGGRVAVLADSSEGIKLAKATSDEVLAVAIEQGVAVNSQAVHDHIDRALALQHDHKPSMLQDLEAGRETEIESLCGEIDRLGRQFSISVPLNRTLATLVRLRQQVATAPGG